jgi:hypothetical protein
MKPLDRNFLTDALLPLLLVVAVFGAIALCLNFAYRAGYRDAQFEQAHRAKDRITKEEIEKRNR